MAILLNLVKDVVCQKNYVVSITLVHSVTGHSVVTYHNTLSNNASIDVIRFYIIIVPFSNENRTEQNRTEQNRTLYL